ncbi:hypothetical protein HYH03_012595 [Edaphochlamys debaryana]|uniref:RED-like N-terminal domain-containing protein n=1 Tax=Edaphochlamys debaryana TaxID=47281 RepID=A0A835XXQ9_9CHLO|nr:hypothetical protein HYH03_012595 [Edaphochlamys debaryana]|eukprot:KAG2488795.1 hypothetical protein HYH03_012595 [Edaphochlamys debaryana]
MDNSDFRKLLETPRAERWASETPSRGKAQATPKPKAEGVQKPHRPKPGFKKPADKGKAADEEEDDGPKYRDRAEERRRGKNLDYEEASAVLSALAGSAGPDPGLGLGGLAAGGVDLSRLSEEETKYLGGDMRFTHLVKGLDYALLHKTRTEITKQGPEDEDEEECEGGPRPAAAGVGRGEASRDAAARSAAKANTVAAAAAKQELKFTTPLARSLYSTLFQPPRSNARELYLPRRTAFVYDFDNEDSLDTDIPTTLRRPKSECPPPQDALFARVDGAVLDRITRIMGYVRTTADGKRLKRRDRDALLGLKSDTGPDAAGAEAPLPSPAAPAAPPKPAGPVDEDDDIFGDAGTDYRPTRLDKDKGAARDAAGTAGSDQNKRPDGSYFGARDTMEDIPMPGTRRGGAAAAAGAEGADADMDLEEGEAPAPGPSLPPPPGAAGAAAPGYGAAYGADPYYQQAAAGGAYCAAGSGAEPRWRSAARVKDPEADDDAYAECYPGMAGFVGALVDSDDEGAGGDLESMDSKQAGKGKTRADFATDEEWQKHKESRETLPRAAFQYGVKRADGRKSHKELEKGAVAESKQQKQKLEGQLKKIERILVDKGHEHTAAFARKPKDADGMGGAMGGGGGGGRGDETPSIRKRQRI